MNGGGGERNTVGLQIESHINIFRGACDEVGTVLFPYFIFKVDLHTSKLLQYSSNILYTHALHWSKVELISAILNCDSNC